MKSMIKRFIFRLSAIPGTLYDNIRRRTKPVYWIMIVGSVCFAGCLPQYYKVNSVKKVEADSIQRLVNENKYFILHTDEEDFALSQVKVNNDHLNAKADTLPGGYSKFLKANYQKAHKYPAKNKELILNTVRLYTSDSVKYNEQISIAVKDFYQMDSYQFNQTKTTWTHVGTIGGLTLAAAALVFVIALIASGAHFGY